MAGFPEIKAETKNVTAGDGIVTIELSLPTVEKMIDEARGAEFLPQEAIQAAGWANLGCFFCPAKDKKLRISKDYFVKCEGFMQLPENAKRAAWRTDTGAVATTMTITKEPISRLFTSDEEFLCGANPTQLYQRATVSEPL